MDYFSILVVDDEVDFLETLVKRLQKRNIDTVGVISGEEALAALEKQTLRRDYFGYQNAGRNGWH